MYRNPLKLFAILSFIITASWNNYAVSSDDIIRIKGSDTLASVANEWGKVFSEKNPGITVVVSGGGSGNGIAALINNHVEIASTSRKLRKREKLLIKKKFKAKPYALQVGLDAVSIFVNNNNPINGISIAQLSGIYRKKSKYNNWSDLGITVPGCESGEIVRTSRKNNSGTYAFFRHAIFGKRVHFNSSLVTHDSSKKVVDSVAKNPCAIGYSGMAFLTSSIKTICVAKTSVQQSCIPPTAAFTLDDKYPLSRPLFMYTLGEPKDSTRDFLTWVLGTEGQDILQKAGFVSPPDK
jgi:phosphate transport system substrate-binding protein